MSLSADIALALIDRARGFVPRYEEYTEGLRPANNPAWFQLHEDLVADAAALLASRGDAHPLIAGLALVSEDFAPGPHFSTLLDRLLPAPADYQREIQTDSHQPLADAKERTARKHVEELGNAETVLSRVIGVLMLDAVERFKVERDGAIRSKEDAETALADERQAVRAALDAFELHAAPKQAPKPSKSKATVTA